MCIIEAIKLKIILRPQALNSNNNSKNLFIIDLYNKVHPSVNRDG